MPAVNVARTDTFEIQRQKINTIATQIFNISAGGSDLATGILKLGDGTKSTPSLAFSTDETLGLYKPDIQTISFVSSGKNILDLKQETVLSYKDFTVRKKSLFASGTGLLLTPGSGYEFGTYTDVVLKGGSGSNGEATVVVDYFSGTSGTGDGYNEGSFTDASLIGGSGTGATVSFNVQGLIGELTDAGSGYAEGAYTDVPLTNGSGTGATANIEVDATGIVVNASITNNGDNNYRAGDLLGANNTDLGGSGSGFEFTVSNNGGIIEFVSITKAEGYTSGDVLTLPSGSTISGIDIPGSHFDAAASLTAGSTTVTVTSTNAIIPGMDVSLVQGGSSVGEFPAATTITVVSITNATTIEVDVAATVSGTAELNFNSPVGNVLTIPGGTSNLYDGFVITGVNTPLVDGLSITILDANTVELSAFPGTSFYQAELTFAPEWGNGGADQYEYTIGDVGVVSNLTVSNPGVGYDVGDILTIDSSDLINPITYNVTAKPSQLITFTTSISSGSIVVGDLLKLDGEDDATGREVIIVNASGGVINSIITLESGFAPTDVLVKTGTVSPQFTVDTETTKNKYFIDTGSGETLHPDLTLYVGETYIFDTAGAPGHPFALSEFPDGEWNIIGPFNATLSDSSDLVTISSTSGIVVGMSVSEVANDPGQLAEGTVVSEIVDGTTVRLSATPTSSGIIVLQFSGTEYTDGIEKEAGSLKIRITDSTASTLYYYCQVHSDMSGEDGLEAVITVDPNNPRVFGSGFAAEITDIDTTDIIEFDVVSGQIDAVTVNATSSTFTNTEVSGVLTALNIASNVISATQINSSTTFDLTVGTTINLNGDINVGAGNLLIDESTGDLLSLGTIKSTTEFNSNESLTISDNIISSINNYDILLEPDLNRIVKVDTNTAFVIPSGNTLERPNTPEAQDGAIRFNTETNQYEGYSTTNAQWSSLGGVRDLDGNTTILAEETVGANDNTLWFINDNINTFKFTPEYQEFVNVKKVRSPNVSAPAYSEWVANSPAALGDYLKYRNNIYEVTAIANTGVGDLNLTAADGSEPTHTSGAVPNGDLELTYTTTAVANLTFEEINELRIDPLGFTDLVVNNELRFSNNTISSNINDIIIEPAGEQKVIIQAASSLVIPVGDNNSKGDPTVGSIRYNTDDLTYEGFDGTAWGSLGGVKDIDQDTYIIPETSPNADEDTLYFYNANNNTLRLTTAGLDFYSIDTITSVTSDTFNFNAATITFDSLATTLDNTSTTETFLFSTKQNFDLGLSSGLTTDPLLRLTDTGDIYYNLGFGTGVYNAIKIFDSELKELEIADYKVVTKKLDLERGVLNSGDAVLYDPATQESAKVFVTAHNTTTGDKHYLEYSVIDKGTDIFFTEIGSILTGEDLVITTFDFTAGNEVRATLTLNTDLTAGDDVEITVVSHITKR